MHAKDWGDMKRYFLMGFGLSFIWPYFYWTFFLVSTFSAQGLSQADPFLILFLISIVVFSCCLTLSVKRVASILDRTPQLLPALCTASAAATVLIHLSGAHLVALPNSALYVLSSLAAAGLPALLFAWAQRFESSDDTLQPRTAAVIVLASMLLFFAYALLFLAFETSRYLLVLGSIVSSLIWLLSKEENSDRAQAHASTAAPQNTKSLSLRRRGARPVLAFGAYAAISIAYWAFFSTETGGAIPIESFSLLGCSPLTQGHPAFYALLLLFFIVLTALALLCRPEKFPRILATLETSLVASVALFLFSLGYLLPSYADVAEGLCCLVRACIQYYLFVIVFLHLRESRVPLIAFAMLWIDAATILIVSQPIAWGLVPLRSVFDNMGYVGFALGAAVLVGVAIDAACAKTENRLEGDEKREYLFHEACAAAASKYGLTSREEEVLFYISQGFSAQKTADILVISLSTVQSHISRIYAKMSVHGKQQLIDRMSEMSL